MRKVELRMNELEKYENRFCQQSQNVQLFCTALLIIVTLEVFLFFLNISTKA